MSGEYEEQSSDGEDAEARVQPVIDRLVEAAHGGASDTVAVDMAALEEYLQETGALDEAGDTWYFASLDQIEDDLNDGRLLDYLELEEDEEPTDAQRVAFARSRLEHILNGEADSDYVPVHMSHQLQHSDGRTAYVVSSHRGYSFTEIRVDLEGPYATDEEARTPYEGAVTDAEDVTDEEILARWDRGDAGSR